jgi:ADP-ribose pyrophosphatase YjhB (NUDIX family)
VARRNDALEICLINPRGRGTWALPKGWIEPGETPETAALREVREETGLDGVIEDELGTIEYWFYSREEEVRVHKTVHFFLMRYTGGDTADHDHEVSEARDHPLVQLVLVAQVGPVDVRLERGAQREWEAARLFEWQPDKEARLLGSMGHSHL